MNPITHALVGWCVAEAAPTLTRRGRALVVLAGVAPDLDGFGILPELLTRDSAAPLFWWSDYHHVLFHNLPSAVLFSLIAAVAAGSQRLRVALLAFVAFHLHLLGDLAGSRGPDGYQWPIPYLYPFSIDPQLVWSGQWFLNAWQNMVITLLLLAITFVLAWKRGYSPVGLLSPPADKAFVATIRARIGGA